MGNMDNEGYMQKMKFPRWKINQIEKNRRNCKHRKTEELIEYRVNYPFGKKSKPLFSFKKVWAKRCNNCFELFKPGDDRFHQDDW